MGNRFLVMNENINGILCPETTSFSMMFLAHKHKSILVGQHVDFYFSPVTTDSNGIKCFKERQYAFEAKIYDHFFEQLFRIPGHLHLWCWGMPKEKAIESLCNTKDMTPDSFVSVVFFTKDLSVRNLSYE